MCYSHERLAALANPLIVTFKNGELRRKQKKTKQTKTKMCCTCVRHEMPSMEMHD